MCNPEKNPKNLKSAFFTFKGERYYTVVISILVVIGDIYSIIWQASYS